MTVVVLKKYVLVGGAWLCPWVNVANTVHPESITVTASSVKTKGVKTLLLTLSSRRWRDKWITNSRNHSVRTNYTLVPMKTVLNGVAFYSNSVYTYLQLTWKQYTNLLELVINIFLIKIKLHIRSPYIRMLFLWFYYVTECVTIDVQNIFTMIIQTIL